MNSKKNGNFYDKILDRMDRLDPENLQTYLVRLMREKGFLEGIFNTIHEGIIVIDNSLQIRIINSAAIGMFGITDQPIGEYIGKYFKQFGWKELLQVSPEEWGRFSRKELEIFYPEHRHLSFYLMPVPERPDMNKSGLPLATLIFHDITESRAAAEEDVETQKVKAITQLAAGVAHELGNPLNSLSIHLQILKRQLTKLENQATLTSALKSVDIAQQELGRLDTIVKNFLNAVRPGKIHPQQIDLRKLLSDAIGFMRPEIENKGIDVTVHLPDNIPALSGDGGQLTQAFYNIIKNALQAMPDGGKLGIGCTVDDIYVHVSFQDSGIGMTDTQISRVFEPYFTTKDSGTGLGLLIVDRIVRAHGGELEIESGPDHGTVFTLSLPRQARRIRRLTAAEHKEQIENDEKSKNINH
ncbi:MAG: ATP-binding protein [Lentisphaeria bacterium]